jgi:RNase P subunit RPR2
VEQSKEIEREKEEVRARTAEAELKLGERRARRKQLRQAVDPELLARYDRVVRLRGVALAEAREQRCMACQVLLRPQAYNELRIENKIVTCDSCSRILYYDPANAPQEQPATESKPTPVPHAWYYVQQDGQGRFLAMTNSRSGCSLRVYDAPTGRLLERRSEKGKSYEEAFAAMLRDARNLFVDDPKLVEESKEQLPEEALLDLQRQVPEQKA